MKTYRFNTTVEKDGSVHLSGLPPHQEVEIVILERAGLSQEVQEWLGDIRSRHPFAKMSKEEILKLLRQTRETVWDERHEN
jgi:hypothetical protein